mgnify:CR=1 FL=1
MYKLLPAFLLVCLLPLFSIGQYYQKDILSTRQTVEQIKQYKANKVRKVILTSFEGTGQPVDQFLCFQEISPTYNIIKTFSQTMQTMQHIFAATDLSPLSQHAVDRGFQLAQVTGARYTVMQALGLEPGRVNVKAKTAERLGPVGQGLAIEARAVALLVAA